MTTSVQGPIELLPILFYLIVHLDACCPTTFTHKETNYFPRKLQSFVPSSPITYSVAMGGAIFALGPKCQIPPCFTKPFVKDTQFFHTKQLAIGD